MSLVRLSAALQHLQDAQLDLALDELIEAWRESKRHPAIADAIDLLSATVTENEPPIRAVGAKTARAAWDEAAQSKRTAGLGRLIEAIAESTDRFRQLNVLIAMRPDPRLATAAKRWLEVTPARGTSRAPFCDRVVALIEHTGDVRLIPFLAAITQPENRARAIAAYGRPTWPKLIATSERLGRRRVTELDAEDTKTLAAIAKIVRAPKPNDATEMFARVYADPDDDTTRAVLADLLHQQGVPRGEFIAMQLARHGSNQPPTAAEKKLLQQWGTSWLGPLRPAFQMQGLVFERGFVSGGRYVGGNAGASTIGRAEWSTVTHLDVTAASEFAEGSTELFFSAPAARLRHVIGMSPLTDLPRLRERAQPMPWLTVGWRGRHWHHFQELEQPLGPLFARARQLVLRADHDDTFSVSSDELLALLEQWPSIVDFEVDTDPDLIIGLRADARGRELSRIVLDGPMGVLTIENDRLDFCTRFCSNDVTNLLADMVRRVDVRHVTLRGEKKPLVKGDYFFQDIMRMSLIPLREATNKAGIGLTVEGELRASSAEPSR